MKENLKSISIYKYNDKLILVPEKKYKSGLTGSQLTFTVIDLNIPVDEIWNLIIENLHFFKQLDTEFDRNSDEHKYFNQKLRKSVKARSYTEFWENSAFGRIIQKDEKLYLSVLNRAKTFKGYQGFYLEPEEYGLNDKSIIDRMLKKFNEVLRK